MPCGLPTLVLNSSDGGLTDTERHNTLCDLVVSSLGTNISVFHTSHENWKKIFT